jgi:hypothetical protein
MKFKISEKAKKEFEFYKNLDLDLIGHIVTHKESRKDENDIDGYSALECWYSIDTHGKFIPCRENDVLQKVLRTKQSINLQIEMWADDIANVKFGCFLLSQEELYYDYGLKDWPEWVFRAVMRQAHLKQLRHSVGDENATCVKGYEKLGLGFRYCRLEYIYGNVLMSYMDDFDPII